jgi:hypothetical protein
MTCTKTFLGALAALSLAAFAVPSYAATTASTSRTPTFAKVSNVPVQLAEDTSEQMENKAQGKINEGSDMATGAGNAVEDVHRQHEATEGMHHGLKDKAETKMREGEDMGTGAANAVKGAHENHQAQEGETH